METVGEPEPEPLGIRLTLCALLLLWEALGKRENDALPVTLAVLHSEMEAEAEEDGSAEADGASEAVTEGEMRAVTLC